MPDKTVKNKPFMLAIAGLLVYFIPFIFSGEDSNIIIHDNLDSNVTDFVVLSKQGKTFSLNPNTSVEPPMGGRQRMFFPPGFSIRAILFVLFPPFAAFLINFIGVHLIAFAGMYLLLKKYVLTRQQDAAASAFTALCFSIIPFYTIYGLSVAGTPLLLFAFLNLWKYKASKLDYWIIGLFPLYSSLVLVGIFFIACLIVWGFVDYYKTRTINRNLIKGTALLCVSYWVVNYQFLYQVVFRGDLVSHRTEFVVEKFELISVIERSVSFFNELHYHVSSPLGFLFLIVVAAVFFGIATRHPDTKTLVLLTVANMVIAFIYCLFNWEMLEPLWEIFPLLKQFQWNRFYYLSPLIWFVQLALALKLIKDVTIPSNLHKIALCSSAAYVVFFLWKANTEFRETTSNLFSKNRTGWSFKQFFDEELFSEIREFIGKPVDQYRVASLGLHPAVALYNGFYTIDGYLPSYPLPYKKAFRKLIGEELEKPDGLKAYFDDWGSRCYMFPSELGYNFTVEKSQNLTLKDLRYDFSQGPKVDYIFSAARIEDPETIGLKFLRSFEHEGSKWKIFLYEVQNYSRVAEDKSVAITIRAQVRQYDAFQIFYVPEGQSSFDEAHSLTRKVFGKNDDQEINFLLPDSVQISRLRLDIGLNSGQETVKIKSIVFKKGQTEQPVALSALQPNQFIQPEGGDTYRTQILEGRYDPYFEFDAVSLQQYNSLRLAPASKDR